MLFASDNVDHLMAVTDRIIVLRHGRCTAEYRTDETGDRDEILAAMVGAADQQQLTPIIWALDSYYRAREQAEKLYQRQSLLERQVETPRRAQPAAHRPAGRPDQRARPGQRSPCRMRSGGS